jgi:hypothetical protein
MCKKNVIIKDKVDIAKINTIKIEEIKGFMKLKRMEIIKIREKLEREKKEKRIKKKWKVMLGGLWM